MRVGKCSDIYYKAHTSEQDLKHFTDSYPFNARTKGEVDAAFRARTAVHRPVSAAEPGRRWPRLSEVAMRKQQTTVALGSSTPLPQHTCAAVCERQPGMLCQQSTSIPNSLSRLAQASLQSCPSMFHPTI